MKTRIPTDILKRIAEDIKLLDEDAKDSKTKKAVPAQQQAEHFVECPDCSGSGLQGDSLCARCSGSGKVLGS